ncbi:MAG: DUF418 domain-containing protein [Caldilineaceae bacterium]
MTIQFGDGITIKERISSVDILRGFALLGILLINIGVFSNAPGGPPAFFAEVSQLDRSLQNLILLFIESKFFSLFSFLFGLGFAIQLIRAAQKTERFETRFTRRLLALLAFGIAHVIFVWDGDILLIYAITGFILLAFRKMSDTALLRWAFWLLTIPVVLLLIAVIGLGIARTMPSTATALASADKELVTSFTSGREDSILALQTNSYREIAQKRIAEYFDLLGLLLSRIPTVLSMFLLGLYAGRRGILQNVEAHLALFRSIRKWGWLIGLPLNLLVVIAINQSPPITGIALLLFNQYLLGPILALTYISTVILLLRQPAWANLLGWLAYPGRMALTNYLGQSVIMSFIFWSWGFALTGKLDTFTGLLIGFGIYFFQIVVSQWWLSRFLYGPLEWLWRCVTYLRWQPIAKTQFAE